MSDGCAAPSSTHQPSSLVAIRRHTFARYIKSKPFFFFLTHLLPNTPSFFPSRCVRGSPEGSICISLDTLPCNTTTVPSTGPRQFSTLSQADDPPLFTEASPFSRLSRHSQERQQTRKVIDDATHVYCTVLTPFNKIRRD